MAKKSDFPTRRYGVIYFFGEQFKNPDAWGSTNTFVAACGNAARHVARSDFGEELERSYRRAVIYDKWDKRIVRMYSRTKDGITIRDYKPEEYKK